MAKETKKSDNKKPADPPSRELKPGQSIVGIGKTYKAGTKRSHVPESVIKKHNLADYLFVGGPDKPKAKAAEEKAS